MLSLPHTRIAWSPETLCVTMREKVMFKQGREAMVPQASKSERGYCFVASEDALKEREKKLGSPGIGTGRFGEGSRSQNVDL